MIEIYIKIDDEKKPKLVKLVAIKIDGEMRGCFGEDALSEDEIDRLKKEAKWFRMDDI